MFISMGLNQSLEPSKTVDKHAKDLYSETEHQTSENQHENTGNQYKSIPPFPYKTKQTFPPPISRIYELAVRCFHHCLSCLLVHISFHECLEAFPYLFTVLSSSSLCF